ncbi:MAG: hypothetical protein WBG90_10440 [Saonia sp.]
MKQLQQIMVKTSILTLCLMAIGVYGQHTKTYKETFNVGNDAVLDINTSYTDIEFETWNKDQIQIEAEITLNGASEEEAEVYFENAGIKIVGNSKNIEVSTRSENTWGFNGRSVGNVEKFHITIPDIPNLEPLFLDLQIPDLPVIPEMPPMPPMPIQSFDYGEYKKEGEKYLEEWKKKFEESYDDEYKKRLEEWSERLKARVAEREEQMEERKMEREERMKEREEMRKEREEMRKERVMEMEEQKREMEERKALGRNIIISRDDGPNVFYWSSEGRNKNYKVKKTIKIKMPKSTKLKMNVRHGEVKLAENTKNIHATLSYTSLLASTIDGDKTFINASYSPVSVQKWNYGQLKTDYSDKVNLREVGSLRLSAVSSDITIDHLLSSIYAKNNLGELKINSISDNFNDMDITVQNGELVCVLPKTPFSISVNGISSKFSSPAGLSLDKTQNNNTVLHKGYHINKNSGKSIVITSKYSEVVLER